MTKRERVLATIVLCTLPFALLLLGFFLFMNKLNANDVTLAGLMSQTSDLEMQEESFMQAKKRKRFFRETSLPLGGKLDYNKWLIDAVKNAGLKHRATDEGAVSPIFYITKQGSKDTIANRHAYSIKANGPIGSLTQFLYDFYSLDMTHRVNSIGITTSDEKNSKGEMVRNSNLSITLEVEALQLVDAEEARDFVNQKRELDMPFEDYEKLIAYRNIFGVANSPPTVVVSKNSSYLSTSKSIKVRLSTKDVDEQDKHSFKLIKSSIEGAELISEDPERGTAQLSIPKVAAGKYEFTVAGMDNGNPPKSSEKEFYIVVNDPKPTVTKTTTVKKKKIKHAGNTVINGHVRERSGDWKVWINVRSLGQKHKLKQGESFELDDKKWTVQTLNANEIILATDEKVMTFQQGDRLDNPSGGTQEP